MNSIALAAKQPRVVTDAVVLRYGWDSYDVMA